MPPKKRENKSIQTVVKSNKLIQLSKYSLTVTQQKILLYCISCIDAKAENPSREITMDMKDFIALANTETKGLSPAVANTMNYKRITETLEAMRSQSFTIYDDNGLPHVMGWIDEARIEETPGSRRRRSVRVWMNEGVMPYLTNLKNLYTSYSVGYIMPMRSVYSIRFYELLLSYYNGDNPGTYAGVFRPVTPQIDQEYAGSNWYYKDFGVKELKEMLSPSQEQIKMTNGERLAASQKDGRDGKFRAEKPLTEKYVQFSDFRKNVLEPAMREINEMTDINVAFSPLSERGSKKIVQVRFFMRKKEAAELEELAANRKEPYVVQEKVTSAAPKRRAQKEEPPVIDAVYTEVEEGALLLRPEDAVTEKAMEAAIAWRVDRHALSRYLSDGQQEVAEMAIKQIAQLCRRNQPDLDEGYFKNGVNTRYLDGLNKVLAKYGSLTPLLEAVGYRYDIDVYFKALDEDPKIHDPLAVFAHVLGKDIETGTFIIERMRKQLKTLPLREREKPDPSPDRQTGSRTPEPTLGMRRRHKLKRDD